MTKERREKRTATAASKIKKNTTVRFIALIDDVRFNFIDINSFDMCQMSHIVD